GSSMYRRTICLLLLSAVLFAGCIPAAPANSAVKGVSAARSDNQAVVVENVQPAEPADDTAANAVADAGSEPDANSKVDELGAPAPAPTATATRPSSRRRAATPTPTPATGSDLGVVGPSNFPEGVNPLTGLPVEDPENLALSPVLVSITN